MGAECAPVAQTFYLDTFVQATLQLDGIVCVCDCQAMMTEKERGVAAEQLAPADVVLLNKATEAASPAMAAWVRTINGTATVITVPRVAAREDIQLDPSQIFRIGAFALDQACLQIDGFGEECSHSHHGHQHDKLGYRSVGLQSAYPIDWLQTRKWL